MKRMAIVCLALIGCAWLAACSDPQTRKQQHVRKGDDLVSAKSFSEAALEYRAALKIDEKDGDVRFKLANAYAETDQPELAAREYLRAADLLPTRPDVALKAAAILLLGKDFDRARHLADTVLAADPRNVDAQIVHAQALARLQDVSGALNDAQDAIRNAPESGRGYVALGSLQATSGNRADAETAFRRAVEIDPRSVSAKLALAYFLWTGGERTEADATVKAALALQPDHLLANKMAALFASLEGRDADAEAPLKRLAAQNDSTASSILADYYAQSGRNQEAKTIYTQLAQQPARKQFAEVRLAELAYADGQRQQADAQLAAVLKENPNNIDALLARTTWLLKDGDATQAEAAATTAVTADAKSATARYMLAQAQLALGKSTDAVRSLQQTISLNPQAAIAQAQLAKLLARTGKPDEAFAAAESAVRTAPSSEVTRVAMVEALFARNDAGGADRALTTLRQDFPKSAPVHALSGQLYQSRKDSLNALKEYDLALALDPTNLKALTGRTALDLAAHQTAEARARIAQAIEKAPKNGALLLLGARVDMTIGDPAAAEQKAQRALQVDPENMDVYDYLGRLYLRENKLEQARAQFASMAERQPDSIAAKTMLALIYSTQGKMDESRKMYEDITSRNPNAVVAANNLAWIYVVKKERLDDALVLAQRAKQRNPNSPEISDTLGWVYYTKDMPQLAIASLMFSAEKDPKNPMYQYHLGMAYAKAKQPKEAREALEGALRLNPSFPGADDARAALASLKG
jgi:tetratricopeptide (TPR) repeat protein